MADTRREIERKYESKDSGLPDLTGVPGVAAVVDKGVAHLDATYYDTADQRLAAASVTLRRRTGGSDAGWHLKLPVAPGVRDEVHAPLSDRPPRRLVRLVRSRTRGAALEPVARLVTDREVHDLVDDRGGVLAEVAVDAVCAERLGEPGVGHPAQWSEIEVEAADGADPGLLDAIDKRMRKAGVRPSRSSSKLAHALARTAPGKPRETRRRPPVAPAPVTAGDHVLAYARAQRDALVALDPQVRLGLPDSVHRMRVATRRLRGALRSYRAVLDRAVTDPVGGELKWLGAELGVGRDQEVIGERLSLALDDVPRRLIAGPVRTRLRTWSHARGGGSRRRLVAVLDGGRYLALLAALDDLLAEPPTRPRGRTGKPAKVMGKAVRKDFGRMARLIERALALPPGPDRDLALHEARKEAKRTRYSAEAATPPLGDAAAALVRSAKALQNLLGDHQDSVMTREALREVARQAHAAGESGFTYGVLYGREERRAAEIEAALPTLWRATRGGP
ncbi:CHAD domain-containing protein [Streptomyces sp. WMMC905]|uniref:CYTH and CHAD domain-containing protein n=1 Tax=Streptomyces sp. WMMC905 TaxID=3404123 RepID=UPI003B94AFE5